MPHRNDSPSDAVGLSFLAFEQMLEVARLEAEQAEPPNGYEVVLLEGDARVCALKEGHLNSATAKAWRAQLQADARRWYRNTPAGRIQNLTGAREGIARTQRRIASARGLTVAHNTGD